MMAEGEVTVSSTADQLLNFVSNASKELKDLLGKVDNEEGTGSNTSLLPPGFNVHLSSTPMSSPIPSPTPSCMSSLSDQEVPSMSPGFLTKTTQRRLCRKRSLDSAGETPSFDFSAKYRRADSVGDYEDYYPSCSTVMRGERSGVFPMGTEYKSSNEVYRKSYSQNYHHTHAMRTSHQQLYDRPMQKLYMQNYVTSPFLSNQQNYVAQNFDSHHGTSDMNTNVPTPDFEDLVSWMVAEDFLDAETLRALLLRC